MLGRHARGTKSSSSSSSVVRERAQTARTQGAPRASMRSLYRRAHHSRFEICNQISSRKIVSCCFRAGRKLEGPPGFPGGPSAQERGLHVMCGKDLRRYPYRNRGHTPAFGRRGSSTGAILGWTTRSSPRLRFDYVGVVSTRRVPLMLVRITAPKRSVKPFLDENYKGSNRFGFRHRREFSNATIVTGSLSASSTWLRRPSSSPPASTAVS